MLKKVAASSVDQRFPAMGDRPKRPKLGDRCDYLDVLREMLHTGGVSTVGLRQLLSKMKTSGFTAETLQGRRIMSEANSERLPQYCVVATLVDMLAIHHCKTRQHVWTTHYIGKVQQSTVCCEDATQERWLG
jgi:hypothetical protein